MSWWKSEEDLGNKIKEIVRDHAFDERMKFRAEAASKARKLIEGKLV